MPTNREAARAYGVATSSRRGGPYGSPTIAPAVMFERPDAFERAEPGRASEPRGDASTGKGCTRLPLERRTVGAVGGSKGEEPGPWRETSGARVGEGMSLRLGLWKLLASGPLEIAQRGARR